MFSSLRANRRCPFLFVPAAEAAVSALRRAQLLDEFIEKLSARKGRNAYAPRAPGKASAEGKRKATHFREWLLVEVTGLEPVTLCRLADDEPGCNREKEKALTFVSA